MADLTGKQATARRFIGDDLADAIRDVADAIKLLPHAGLDDPAALKADLVQANAALVKARQTATDQGIKAHND